MHVGFHRGGFCFVFISSASFYFLPLLFFPFLGARLCDKTTPNWDQLGTYEKNQVSKVEDSQLP